MSNATKRNAQELQDALNEQRVYMTNMVSFAKLHVKDPELVSRIEAHERGIKDTVEYIKTKLGTKEG